MALAAWAYAAQTVGAQAVGTEAGGGQAAGARTPDSLPVEEATPLPAAGADGGAAPGAVVSTWDFVRMVLILAAVVAAIYLLFLVLRKVTGHRAEERGLIRVLDSKTLAPGRSLHLVDVSGRTYLVGCSESAVSMVASIPAQGPADGAPERRGAGEPGRRPAPNWRTAPDRLAAARDT